MAKGPRRVTRRTVARLHKAAYEYEHLAANLRAEGFDTEANTVNRIASQLGAVSRHLENNKKLQGYQ